VKLGFLQAGMPKWTNAEIAEKANQLGFDGVGIGRRQLSNGVEISDGDLNEVKQTFNEAGVEIYDLSLHARPTFPGIGSNEFDWDEITAELVPIAQLASKLGVPSISVMIQRPSPGAKWDWTEYLNNLARASLTALGETKNVRATFQNHVGSASATQLLEMVERNGDSRLGVSISPDHCIVMQENPVELADRHCAVIQHVSMADRKVVQSELGTFDGRFYYVRYEACIVGQGVVPAERLLDKLAQRGYKGYVSLKWEKSDVGTGPHLPTGYGWHLPWGDAVLPAYAELMRSLGVK